MSGSALDLYAGMGGWSEGMATIGVSSVGIELDMGNAALALERLGPMLLDVDWPAPDWTLATLPAGSPAPGAYEAWKHLIDDNEGRVPVAVTGPAVPHRRVRVPAELEGQVAMFTDHEEVVADVA